MIDIIGTLRHIGRRVEQLFDFATATLTLAETGGTINTAVLNTEYDVYINNAPPSIFEPLNVIIDFTAQTGAETTVVRVYYRIAPTGGLVLKDEETYIGAQDPVLIDVGLEPNRYGVQVTIERTAGAAQDYDWSVIYRG